MSDMTFAARLAALGLNLADAEKPPVAELVAEMDRAAAVVRAMDRGYFDEPSNVFRLAPATPGTSGGRSVDG